MKNTSRNDLPVIKQKKKIDLKKFEKLAKKVRKYFVEEEKFLEKSQKNDTNNQAVGFSFCS